MITLQWKELSHHKRIPRNARREPRWFQGRGVFARFVQDRKRFCSMTIKAPTGTSISCEKEALVFFFLSYILRRRDEHVSSMMTGRKSFWSRVYEKPVSLRFFREFEPYDPWYWSLSWCPPNLGWRDTHPWCFETFLVEDEKSQGVGRDNEKKTLEQRTNARENSFLTISSSAHKGTTEANKNRLFA